MAEDIKAKIEIDGPFVVLPLKEMQLLATNAQCIGFYRGDEKQGEDPFQLVDMGDTGAVLFVRAGTPLCNLLEPMIDIPKVPDETA